MPSIIMKKMGRTKAASAISEATVPEQIFLSRAILIGSTTPAPLAHPLTLLPKLAGRYTELPRWPRPRQMELSPNLDYPASGRARASAWLGKRAACVPGCAGFRAGAFFGQS